MKMDFSVGLGRNESINEVAGLARVAEEYGFSHLTFVDQPNLSRDVFVMMTVAALNTKHIFIGQGVTDPLTTHISVIANATATVNELSGGRAFLGIGAGGPFGKVTRPATTKELREAIEFIRTYMRGREAEIRGAKMHSEWVRSPVPVYIAAEGVRTLRLVGEVGDGVILGGSIHPDIVKWKVDVIRGTAREAGRDPSKIAIWMRTMICIAETKESARREVAGQAVTKARGMYHVIRRDNPEVATIRALIESAEPGLIEEFKGIFESWDPYQHELRDAPINTLVSQRAIDFFFLTGTVDDICEGIAGLERLGVNNISIVTFTVVDKKGMMQEIGEKVIPHFRN